jgi:transcriptional regulator with XRE-family HTH domain
MKYFKSYPTYLFVFFIFTLPALQLKKSWAAEPSVSRSCEQFLNDPQTQDTAYDQESLVTLLEVWRKTVGQRLNEAILNYAQKTGKKYTLIRLAREVPIDNSSISKYINGYHSIPFVHAQRISEILDVKLEWLLAQDLLLNFHINRFRVKPEHFIGIKARSLSDAFTAFIWSQPQDLNLDPALVSDLDPNLFCIENCSTEELTNELLRRGWQVTLTR